MKIFVIAAAIFVLSFANANAQFKTEGAQEPTLNTVQAMKDGDSFFSRLFDPSRFSMHQSYSMSVASSSFGSYGLSMFTNTFSFRPDDNIVISADVSAVYSPFNTFGNSAFAKQMNGVYLTSARMDWKLSENSSLRIEYLGGPPGIYGNGMYGSGFNNGYSDYGSPFVNPAQSPASPVLVSAGKKAISSVNH